MNENNNAVMNMEDGHIWNSVKRSAVKRSSNSELPETTSKMKTTTTSFFTKNRFEPLQSSEVNEDRAKIPPIYLKNMELKNYKEFIDELKILVGDNFQCQATNKNGVTIYPLTTDAYRTLIRALKDTKYEFHCYQLPHEKAYRVVLRHLHPNTDVNDIKIALEELSFNVRSVVNVLQSGTRVPLPLFFVDLEPHKDNEKIFEIKSLLYTRIRVEEPRKKTELLMCKRCLQFGHTRSYCHHPVKCARCCESHPTSACVSGGQEKRKCILCGGDHSSLYRGCQIYKELRSKKNSSRTMKRPSEIITNLVEQSATTPAPNQPVSIINRNMHDSSHKETNTKVQQNKCEHPLQQSRSDTTVATPRNSQRDPRLSSISYSQILSQTNDCHSSYSTPLPQSSYHPNPTAPVDIQQTLQIFFTRFQELLAPLISTLNLLVNKLLK
jgi:hypothetical protein